MKTVTETSVSTCTQMASKQSSTGTFMVEHEVYAVNPSVQHNSGEDGLGLYHYSLYIGERERESLQPVATSVSSLVTQVEIKDCPQIADNSAKQNNTTHTHAQVFKHT